MFSSTWPDVEQKHFAPGVASGPTISHMALNTPQTHFYGFDSFEGLPEAWRSGFEKGVFAQARLPAVPSNVTLVKGWFDETLPDFLQERPQLPLSLLHIDCDLYSSTRTIFASLQDRVLPGHRDRVRRILELSGVARSRVQGLRGAACRNRHSSQAVRLCAKPSTGRLRDIRA